MKITLLKWCRLAAMGIAGLAMCQALQAAELLNGGFDNGKTNWTGSNFKAGNEGGDGWNTTYFGGSFPTNSTFATGIESTIRQNLSGAGNTFVEGTTYAISMSIFGSSNYSTGTNNLWSLGFTADGTLIATDHWFSEEFTASTVGAGNGGTIPNDHITTVASGSTGLKTVTFTYTATAADAGKVIGVQMGGHTQNKYTLAPGAPTTNARYAMMDNVTFSLVGAPSVASFTSDFNIIDGLPITLSWEITDLEYLSTLTLDDGTGPVSVLANTDLETGYGQKEVNPNQNTTYTLTANGGSSRTVTIYNGAIDGFSSDTVLAMGPDYQATLSWSIQPAEPASVTISDGITTTDVTADTSGGYGSRSFTVPSGSTTFTLSVNNGSVTRTRRVLRAMENSPAFFIDKASYVAGEPTVTTWAGTGGNSASWVGIYSRTKTPGAPNEYSDQWNYLNGTKATGGNHTSGTLSFTLPAGEYYAALFVDGGYVIEQGPIAFTVTEPVVPEEPLRVTSIKRTTDLVAGEQLTITWDSKADLEYDIYASETLEGDPLLDWDKVGDAVPSAGDESTSFTEDLPQPTPERRFYRVYEVEP